MPGAFISAALVSGFHQTAADGPILRRGIDGDRAETSDRIAFVQKIAADDAPVARCGKRPSQMSRRAIVSVKKSMGMIAAAS